MRNREYAQVQMAPDNGEALLALTLNAGTSLEDAANKILTNYKLEMVESKKETINGLAALTMIADQKQEQGTIRVISGGADDIWIFQIAGDLTVSSAKNITLTGGAQAKNIFWQVAGEATMGANSHVEGNILSMTGITMQTGASLNGRALAQTAVILDGNTVVKP